ncbi:Protein of unknown function [Pyronema omphalodes CBS 100304]|uniref:Uncharacterized protein n=1 Tax=Pyronema omphalodes (strain CBS 100304) TaxID=1076935 RepID=U4LTW1_PYROM|nr:Protein of unknown function [Pyronema omphalodes CBS 100304]
MPNSFDWSFRASISRSNNNTM